MAFTVDFNVASPTELAVAANTFTQQATGEIVSLEESLDSLTESVVSNCDILGSLSDLVSGATKKFSDSVTKGARDFQVAAGKAMKTVGSNIKLLKAKLDNIAKTIRTLFFDMSKFTLDLFDRAKGFLTTLKGKLTSIVDRMKSSMSDLMAVASKMKADFSKGLKNLKAKSCSVAMDAIKSIGTGAGIDSAVSSVTGGIDDALANTKSSLLDATKAATESITTKLNSVTTSFDTLETSFA